MHRFATFLLCFLAGFFNATSQSKQQNSINNGLVIHLPFSGNAQDISGNGNNGMIFGCIPTSDRFNLPNSAYFFDGVNDYIRIENSPSLCPKNEISISVWIKTDYALPFAGIVSKGQGSEPRCGYDLNINEESKLRGNVYLDHSQSKGACVFSKSEMTDNQWHHAVAIYNGEIFKLYIDGKIQDQYAYSGGFDPGKEPVLIGWDQSTWLSHRHFNGFIDDIRIYNRALEENEVVFLFNENVRK